MTTATLVAPLSAPAFSLGDLLSTLNSGFNAAETAIITSVASWSLTELVKLGTDEISKMNQSLNHFVANIRSGMGWGAAMASLLTEVWNGVKSELAQLATDMVEAVGKLFQTVGLIPQTA